MLCHVGCEIIFRPLLGGRFASQEQRSDAILAGWKKKAALNDPAAWTISPTGAREPTHELPPFQTALNQ